jgi:hypothetical protein
MFDSLSMLSSVIVVTVSSSPLLSSAVCVASLKSLASQGVSK